MADACDPVATGGYALRLLMTSFSARPQEGRRGFGRALLVRNKLSTCLGILKGLCRSAGICAGKDPVPAGGVRRQDRGDHERQE